MTSNIWQTHYDAEGRKITPRGEPWIEAYAKQTGCHSDFYQVCRFASRTDKSCWIDEVVVKSEPIYVHEDGCNPDLFRAFVALQSHLLNVEKARAKEAGK